MPLTFDTLIQHNIRTSRALIAAIVCLMALLCGLISVAISGGAPGILPDMFATGCAVGLALALAGSGVSWFMGGSVIASITGARQIEHGQDPVLINVVEEMAIAAGVPVPAVYLIDDPSPNAFATGRDPQHALIAVTSGLREKLNREELQAVVAHEMAHIKNYDIRLMMLVAVFAGMMSMSSHL